MIDKKVFSSIVLTAVLVAGCASNGTANTANQESYNAALAAAKDSLQHAKNANYEWRDSGKILNKAESAAKVGDYSTAIKLAKQVKYQGDQAVVQSKEQMNAGMRAD